MLSRSRTSEALWWNRFGKSGSLVISHAVAMDDPPTTAPQKIPTTTGMGIDLASWSKDT